MYVKDRLTFSDLHFSPQHQNGNIFFKSIPFHGYVFKDFTADKLIKSASLTKGRLALNLVWDDFINSFTILLLFENKTTENEDLVVAIERHNTKIWCYLIKRKMETLRGLSASYINDDGHRRNEIHSYGDRSSGPFGRLIVLIALKSVLAPLSGRVEYDLRFGIKQNNNSCLFA